MPAFSVTKLRVNLHTTFLFLLLSHPLWENKKVRGTVLWFPSWLGIQASEEPQLHDSHRHCPRWGHSPKQNSPAHSRITDSVNMDLRDTFKSRPSALPHLESSVSKGRLRWGTSKNTTESLKLAKGKGKKGILRGSHFTPWGMASNQSTWHVRGPRTPFLLWNSRGTWEHRPASQLLHRTLPNLQRLNHLPKETLPWNKQQKCPTISVRNGSRRIRWKYSLQLPFTTYFQRQTHSSVITHDIRT